MSGVNWKQSEVAALALPEPAQMSQPTLRTHNLTAHARATGRIRQPKGMNKTEARYGALLEARKALGDVIWYRYEGITLKLADDTRYTADFAVMMAREGEVQLHEVKGRGKNGGPRFEDDARVKIACAAELYPFRFFMVWPGQRGEWESKEF